MFTLIVKKKTIKDLDDFLFMNDFFINKGNRGEGGGAAGDLIIKINVKPDPYYKREGFDIHTDANLTISQVFLLILFFFVKVGN